jgi:hypothetical protein
MVGTFSSRVLELMLGALLAAATVTESVGAEPVKGQSRELGIQFEVRGGATWCAPDVAVALTATKPDAFKPESQQFVLMLGRIRAVVMDQCPAVERLIFDGAAEQRAVISIEMTRLTKWRRLIKLDPKTRRPPCPGPEPAATECGKRVEAYLVAHKVMRGDQFSTAELTTVLDDSESAHAIWQAGEVTGKLTIKERNEFAGRFASNSQLAEAVLHSLTDGCSRDGAVHEGMWSAIWSEGSGREAAVRGVSCHPPTDVPNHHALIVTSVGTRFHVFALLTRGNDAQTVNRAAQSLALAITESQ